MLSAMLLSLNYTRLKKPKSLMLTMPTVSKQVHMVEDVVGHYVQRKRACILCKEAQLLDDLPSSDSLPNPDTSDSESSSLSLLSSISSPSSGSSECSSSSSFGVHSEWSSTSSDDFDDLEDKFVEWWEAQIQGLVSYLLSEWVLQVCPPVKKSG